MMKEPLLMILDDEEGYRGIVEFVGKSMGFEVQSFHRVADLLAAMKDLEPDGIVTDIVLPERDGNELIWQLARRNCVARIILMSGYSGKYIEPVETYARCRGLHIVGTLSKPFGIAHLEELLSELRVPRGVLGESNNKTKGHT